MPVNLEGRIVAVFHSKLGCHAIDDMCPHRGASLGNGGFDEEEMEAICPFHGWRFNVVTGKMPFGHHGVDTFPVKREDGWIWVELPK